MLLVDLFLQWQFQIGICLHFYVIIVMQNCHNIQLLGEWLASVESLLEDVRDKISEGIRSNITAQSH